MTNQRPLRFFSFSNCFAFYIRCMIYDELFFVKDRRSVSRFFFHVGMQLFRHHLLKRWSFLCWITSAPLSKISWLYLCGSVSGLFVVFHWSVCVFFHWYHSLDYRHFLVSQVVSVLFVLFLRQWWLFWVFCLSISTLESFCCYSESSMLGFLLGFC